MVLKFKKLKLQPRITLTISTLILVVLMLTSYLFYYILSETVEEQIGKRALHVAKTVAAIPEIKEAFPKENPASVIQPIAERIRMDTEADFIVVGNKEGIRYAHPERDKIGEAMIGGDNKGVLLEGKSYVSKATGSLGPSLRGKVPIRNQENEIIGVVSVGFSMDDIHGAVEVYGKRVFWITIIGLLIGVIGSIYLAGSIKRMMFGMEPEEISSLYEEHSTVIQSVREGIIVIDQHGMISLVNQAAYDILSLDEQRNIIGEFILDVIPNSTILDVLQTGEEQFDRQLNIKGQAVIANRLPIKVKNKVTGVVSSLRLKSEMDQLTAELSQTKQYTEALRAQTHEYNNLLYTLSGLVQLELYEDALELIHKETAVYQDFVQFIMKRIQNPWLGGILIGFYNRARELKIEFMLDRESSLDKLSPHIESNYVVSILGNLITNAFEAIERNEEHDKKVRMFVTDIGEEIVIEVEDSGQGIHDEVITSIFYKGFSTKEGEKRGYGLAKVKELVEDLNGSIAIEKGDLGGALFIIALPKERGEL
ncbi:sensor kinase citA VC0791 [Bacillus cereus G9241]|uniref:ATP-binding protein n=1 Tax=Bacillus TaxID=1386 RepID=UPI00003CBAEA|nr:histidine kinase [Bacillus cereus]EAL14534.1 sensor kinase citA VC0791 [Bacillus cereus G9241]PET35456.1 sensor histidine kinase [Bacillus anthracis]PFA95163.1 sensor histidine kinase [Bacillus anthracis]PFP39839.1 sensor histidine kinase [Bacillus anthracis]